MRGTVEDSSPRPVRRESSSPSPSIRDDPRRGEEPGPQIAQMDADEEKERSIRRSSASEGARGLHPVRLFRNWGLAIGNSHLRQSARSADDSPHVLISWNLESGI